MNYKDILGALKKRGAVTITVDGVLNENHKKSPANADPLWNHPIVVIRHDLDPASLYEMFKGQPDLCFPNAIKMMQAEQDAVFVSSVYILGKEFYKEPLPDDILLFQKQGFEIGFHAHSDNPEQVIKCMDAYDIDFKTFVAHSGNHDISQNLEIKKRVKPLLSPDFQCRNDGYVADNGGYIRKLGKIIDNVKAEWSDVDIVKHIEDMEDDNVYHFSFHPIWWDKDLEYIGIGGAKLKPISASMIVGDVFDDENDYLPQLDRCLESINDAVDEIVILHTDTRDIGSVIAKYPKVKYAQKVYTKDNWDFADARNESLALVTASDDEWVLIIDTDEYLDERCIARMKHVAAITTHDAIQFQVLSDLPSGKSLIESPRLFRKRVAGYKDKIHNQPNFDGVHVISNLRIYHTGYNLAPERMLAKWQRTESMLLRQIEEKPEYWFAWSNLARIYRCQKRYADVITLAEDVIPKLEYNKDTECAYTGIMIDWIFALLNEKKDTELIELGKKMLELNPNVLDIHNFMAGAYLAVNDLDNAIKHFEEHIRLAGEYKASRLSAKTTMDTIENVAESWNNIGAAHSRKGNIQKAKECYEKAIAIDKKPMFVENLQMINKSLAAQGKQSLRILMVQPITCIRNIKMTRALKKAGHRVDLAYTIQKASDTYSLTDDMYDNVFHITHYPELQKLAKNYDIIHSHNEPDILTVALIGHGVVIHDTHDPLSVRGYEQDKVMTDWNEMLANANATGRIYISDLMMQYAKSRYDIDLNTSIVLSNYVSEDDIPKVEERYEKLSAKDGEIHIVYEGGAGHSHRDYHGLFKALADAKIHIHIYPTTYNQAYVELEQSNPQYIHYNHPISPLDLIKEMTKFDAGIVAFNITPENRAFLDIAICNKLYEYLAAGLPVISCDTKTVRAEIEKLKCGFIYDTVEDIVKNIDAIKAIDVSQIPPFTMESQVPRLVEFYQKLIARQGIGDPVTIGQQFLQTINVQEYKHQLGLKPDMNTRPAEYGFIFDTLNEINPEEIIDVGSGMSALPALLRHSGFRVHAIDNMVDYWQQGIINRHYLVQPVDIHSGIGIQGDTDVITCISALEHMKDADLAVHNMTKVLKTGGHLLMTFPYNEAEYFENIYKHPEAGYGQEYPYPCQVFNQAMIDKWCIDNGCEIEKQIFYKCFTGKYWTMGAKIKPSHTPASDAHLTCISIKKVKHVITRDDQIIEERFKGDLSYEVYHGLVEWDEPTRVNIKARIDRIVELSSGRVLDIGCSDGITSILLGEAGKRVIGIDMLQEHIDRANGNLEKASPQAKNRVYFTQGWAEELKYFDDTYDTVVLGEVLEHVVDVDAVLSEIKRVLKPEGQALISVPIGENAVRSHKRFFEQDTLTELLSQYFTVDRIEVFGTQMMAACNNP